MDIARNGARILTAEEFVPSHASEASRTMHKELAPTFRKHIFKLWETGQVMAFPMTELSSRCPEQVSHIHSSVAHWVKKTPVIRNPQGRFCFDASNRLEGTPLNSARAKVLLSDFYGALKHPTIVEIIDGWMEIVANSGLAFHDFLIFKNDVRAGFNQFNINPAHAPLMTLEFESMWIIYLVGTFGWCGSSFVFGLFSRALKRLIERRLTEATAASTCGHIDVYVDDAIGFSLADQAVRDQSIVEDAIISCFGPGSLSATRSPPLQRVEVLGYDIDLVAETILPSLRSRNKLIFFLLSFDWKKQQPVALFQIVASLAERFSHVILGTRPFVTLLYDLTTGADNNPFAAKRANSAQRFVLEIWSAVAVILFVNPAALAVPLSRVCSIRPSSKSVCIVSDYGPNRIGCIIYDADECEILWHIKYRLPYTIPDEQISSLQNACEFQGIMLGMVVLAHYAIDCEVILWKQDNTAALSWAHKGKARSAAAQFSVMFYAWFQIINKVRVVESHRPGVEMGIVDDLSRDRDVGLPDDKRVDQASIARLDELFLACSVLEAKDKNLPEHHSVLQRVIMIVKELSIRK